MEFTKLTYKCSKCDEIKALDEFVKDSKAKNGYSSSCKLCKKLYRENNKKMIDEKNKIYYQKTKEDRGVNNKEYYKENKKYILKRNSIYRSENKDKQNKRHKQRMLSDPLYKLRHGIRGLLNQSFINKGYKKKTKTCDILGCSFEELKSHLEFQFKDWMSWENKGNPKDGIIELNKTWDVDHIIPLSEAKTVEDIIRFNHYTNLQPLCSYDNRYLKRDGIY